MRNTNYLKRYNDQTSKSSKEENISEDEVVFMIDQFFFDFKESIVDPRMPTIKITNLGTFKTTIGKLKWHINIAKYRLRTGKADPKILEDRITYLTTITDRLKKEKKGEETWKEWRDKFKDNEKKSKSKKQKVERKSP